MIRAVVMAMVFGQAGAVPVLTLDEAIREAQAKNYDIHAARARLDQANQASWKAWSGYLPQIGASGNYTHNNVEVVLPFPTAFATRELHTPTTTSGEVIAGTNTPMPGDPATQVVVPTQVENIVIQKQDQLSAQVQLNQALIAPGLWYAIRNAYTGEKIAALGTENVRRQVLFGAAQLYYGAASLKQAVAVQERQLSITRDHERDARVRYEAGTTPKVALLRAEIDRARAEQDLKRAQNAYASAKVSLATVLEHQGGFEVEVPPAQPVPSDEAALEQAALRDRPDVQGAVANVLVTERTRDATYTQYFPTLGAFARYAWANVTGFTGTNTTWAVGLGLNWTIFDGGLREAQLRENQARVVEAEANRRGAESRAIDEVRRSQLDLDSALANKAKAAEQLELARENQKLTEVNYRAGAATYLEVTDAAAALLSAELGQVGETLNAELAALRLLNAAGAFNPK